VASTELAATTAASQVTLHAHVQELLCQASDEVHPQSVEDMLVDQVSVEASLASVLQLATSAAAQTILLVIVRPKP
jgi:hypothetical protein